MFYAAMSLASCVLYLVAVPTLFYRLVSAQRTANVETYMQAVFPKARRRATRRVSAYAVLAPRRCALTSLLVVVVLVVSVRRSCHAAAAWR